MVNNSYTNLVFMHFNVKFPYNTFEAYHNLISFAVALCCLPTTTRGLGGPLAVLLTGDDGIA